MAKPRPTPVEVRVRRARRGRPARVVFPCPCCQEVLEVSLLRPRHRPKAERRCPRILPIPGTETAEDVAKTEAWLASRGEPEKGAA